MELTVDIKKQNDITAFLNLLKELDHIEIVNVKEENQELPSEHKDLLDEKIHRIKNNKTTFKNWDSIKKKY